MIKAPGDKDWRRNNDRSGAQSRLADPDLHRFHVTLNRKSARVTPDQSEISPRTCAAQPLLVLTIANHFARMRASSNSSVSIGLTRPMMSASGVRVTSFF